MQVYERAQRREEAHEIPLPDDAADPLPTWSDGPALTDLPPCRAGTEADVA